jgi:hypothetical protein
MKANDTTSITASIQGEVQTLKVNDKGEETEIKLTVNEFKTTTVENKKPKSTTLPKGTTIIGTASDTISRWTWSSSTGDRLPDIGEKFLSELLFFTYATEPQAEADNLFGTDKQLKVGATWSINGDGLARYMSLEQLMGKGQPQNGTVEASGKGKLEAFSGDGGSAFVDLGFNIKASGKVEPSSWNIQSEFTLRLPRDSSSGPLKRTEKTKMDLSLVAPVPGPDGQPGSPMTIKMTIAVKTAIDVKYLGNFPVEKSDLPTQQEPLVVRLGSPNVQWMEPQQAVNASASYSIVGNGKLKPNALYVLNIKVADSGGIKQSYQVQAQPGAALAPSGILANPSVSVNVPSINRPTVCDLILVEKSGNNPEVEIARLDNVAISGISAAPTPGGRVTFELSKQKVEVLATKKVRFTVDYKVTANNPDPNKTYKLVVNLDDKSNKLQAKPFESKGNQLGVQDTVVKDGAFEVAVGTNFTMSLTEDDGTTAPGVTVSNVLKGQVESGKDSPLPLKIQIMAVANKVAGGGGGGAVPQGKKAGGGFGKQPQQQVIALQLQWTVTAGEINKKNATYAVVVDLKGGKGGPAGHQVVPPQGTVPGASFPKSGGPIPIPLPYGGETNFDVYIVEIIQGQQTLPPPKVSNVVSGRIQ